MYTNHRGYEPKHKPVIMKIVLIARNV